MINEREVEKNSSKCSKFKSEFKEHTPQISQFAAKPLHSAFIFPRLLLVSYAFNSNLTDFLSEFPK